MPVDIYINQLTTVSALGASPSKIDRSFRAGDSLIANRQIGQLDYPVASLDDISEQGLERLRASNRQYARLDRTTLLALLAAEGLDIKSDGSQGLGINLGSSRGATQLLEQYMQEFREQGQVSPFASPTTTAGNISSWVGQHLGAKGVRFDQSVTCSTAFHAILNAVAWLESGMADVFIAGGAEAALTPFTMAQMQALKLTPATGETACRSMDFDKQHNSMVLGEAAGLAVLSKQKKAESCMKIAGLGWSTELLTHPSSISAEAVCFQQSMRAALKQAGMDTVDVIVMHAPGTVQGDLAEFKAIQQLFNKQPYLTSNKWQVGHTFGASGMLSLEQAHWMLKNNKALPNPYYRNAEDLYSLQSVMINAVGFGGNAVSIIVENP